MKNFYILLFTLLAGFCNAQYCGNSGPSVCTPVTDSTAQPGVRPAEDDLAPLVNAVTDEVILQFKNFSTFNFGGQIVTVQSLRFDTIYGLPSGLCWATNKANNTFGTGEEGCIRFSGNLCSAPGQYMIKIIVTADVGVPIIDQGDGLEYFIRVKNFGDPDTPLDSNQTNSFAPYGNPYKGCVSSVSEPGSYSAQVSPNPSHSYFTFQASALNTGSYFNLYDSFGRLVKFQRLTSTNTTIQREALPNGIYFWQVSSNGNIFGRGKLILE